MRGRKKYYSGKDRTRARGIWLVWRHVVPVTLERLVLLVNQMDYCSYVSINYILICNGDVFFHIFVKW